jgi:hypothetical protein
MTPAPVRLIDPAAFMIDDDDQPYAFPEPKIMIALARNGFGQGLKMIRRARAIELADI